MKKHIKATHLIQLYKESQYFFWLCMHLKQEKIIFALILKE